MKKFLLFNILFCAFLGVGYAQTITVSPDVICEGGTSYIGTDTNLNYVHIGDIICVGNTNHDTIIVRPEAWSLYSGSYTALSVVFYVDTTGKHGWAVKAATGAYSRAIWYYNPGQAHPEGLTPCSNNNMALKDLDGKTNTSIIKTAGENYAAANSTQYPFYLPAAGQLYYLFTKTSLVNATLENVLHKAPVPLLISPTTASSSWTSTIANMNGYVYVIDCTGFSASAQIVNTSLYVLPIMTY